MSHLVLKVGSINETCLRYTSVSKWGRRASYIKLTEHQAEIEKTARYFDAIRTEDNSNANCIFLKMSHRNILMVDLSLIALARLPRSECQRLGNFGCEHGKARYKTDDMPLGATLPGYQAL